MWFFYFFARNICYTFSVALFNSFYIALFATVSFIISLTFFPEKFLSIATGYHKFYLLTLISAIFIYYILHGFFTPIGIKALSSRNRRVNDYYKKKDTEVNAGILKDINGFVNGYIGNSVFYILIVHLSMAAICSYKYIIAGEITLLNFTVFIKIISLSFVLGILLISYPSILLAGKLTTDERSDIFLRDRAVGEAKKYYSYSSGFVFFNIVSVFVIFIILFITYSSSLHFSITDHRFNIIYASILTFIFLYIVVIVKISLKNGNFITLKNYLEGEGNGNKEVPLKIPVSKEHVELFSLISEKLEHAGHKVIQKEQECFKESEKNKKILDDLAKLQMQIDKQFGMAELLQRSIIPDKLENWNEIKFTVNRTAITQIGGDFYDLISHDNKRVCILIADPSSFGISAAMLSSMIKVLIHNAFFKKMSPRYIFSSINRNISNLFKSQDYLSCFLAVIDDDYNITYSNASHQKGILLKGDSSEPEFLDTEGIFIGAVNNDSDTYEEKTVKLEYGDRVILYSDGAVEAQNPEREIYGIERFKDSIVKHSSEDIDSFNNSIFNDVLAFTQGNEKKDDITIIAFELVFDKALEFVREAKSLVKKHKYLEAVEVLESGLEKFPDNTKILYNLSKNYFRINNYTKSVNLLRQYIDKDKNNKFAHYVMGASYFQMMKYEEAIECFEKALSIDHSMTNAIFALAMSYKNTADYDKAVFNFEKIINIDPENKLALFELDYIEKNLINKDNSI